MSNEHLTDADYLAARIVVVPGGCWLWQCAVTVGGGYALGYPPGCKQGLIHRWTYSTFVGPIPDGMHLDHTCHTRDDACPGGSQCQHRRCVNPDHLEPVTPGENTARSYRVLSTQNAAKTHCPAGHEYTTDNVYMAPGSNRRECRPCQPAKYARYRARKKASAA